MNIIKFKDVVKTDDEIFNTYFKSQYAYLVRWQYAMPFGQATQAEYTEFEKSGMPESTEKIYIDIADYSDYIEDTATNNANSINKWIVLNNYTTDDDITVDEVKLFRRWLAKTILETSVVTEEGNTETEYNLADDVVVMLKYYAADMYDDVVKTLSMFPAVDTSSYGVLKTSGCGCSSQATNLSGISIMSVTKPSSTLSSLSMTSCGCSSASTSASGTTVCEPLSVYRKMIYYKMVDTFKELDFWTQFRDPDTTELEAEPDKGSLLYDFKKYIDNIIKLDLPLTSSTYESDFVDCGCLSDDDATQKRLMSYLSDLSKSLQYIIDNDEAGHKNFIATAFLNFSMYLYENMQW